LPDLLIVDGGKGQLKRAIKVLKEFELDNKIIAAGLAKENEVLFISGKENPVKLPRNSQGLFLLQRIRDEAHRFAITAHRNKRTRNKFISRLDQIPGIGPSRKRELLKKFGSLAGVKKAAPEDLMTVPGISRELAEIIQTTLSSS
jgi:excinuclease ABC subunit C